MEKLKFHRNVCRRQTYRYAVGIISLTNGKYRYAIGVISLVRKDKLSPLWYFFCENFYNPLFFIDERGKKC